MFRVFSPLSGYFLAFLLVLMAGGLSGCIGEPDYDRRSIDLVFFENTVYVNQTFYNVVADEDQNSNENRRRQYQEWFCDDSSDTFQRTWTRYANKLGMQSAEFRSVKAEDDLQGGCDVKISGVGDNFLHSAVFLSRSLKSDTYRVRRKGDRFEFELTPSGDLDSYNVDFTIWLSDRYAGRLLEANTNDFERDLSPSEVDFVDSYTIRRNLSSTWRRARWSVDKLRRDGIKFVFGGPLKSNQFDTPGIDNRPTSIPKFSNHSKM